MNPYARQAKEYRYQEVMGASPIGLIIIAYDATIAACRRQDLEDTSRALSALRNSLNFEHPEIASKLFALYVWCGDLSRAGKWGEAAGILDDLRTVWVQAERQMNVSRQAAAEPVFTAGQQPVPVL